MIPITVIEASLARNDTGYCSRSQIAQMIYMTWPNERPKRTYVIIASPTAKIFVVNTCKHFNLLSLPCHKDRGNWKCVAK